jgi:hypothetical protein
MRAWGTPEYEGLNKQERQDFTSQVRAGNLFSFVEDAKVNAVRAGVVPEGGDAWLIPLYAGHVQDGKPLPQDERDDLGRITTAMYPYLMRLEAAMAPEAPTPATPATKGTASRDRWFLEQYEARGTDTYHKPAKIHGKWDEMKAADRAKLSPESPNKVTKSAVVQAIKRARMKRDGKPAKPKRSKHTV